MCACCDDNNNSASRMLVSQQSDLQTFRTRSPSPSTKSSSISLVLSGHHAHIDRGISARCSSWRYDDGVDQQLAIVREHCFFDVLQDLLGAAITMVVDDAMHIVYARTQAGLWLWCKEVVCKTENLNSALRVNDFVRKILEHQLRCMSRMLFVEQLQVISEVTTSVTIKHAKGTSQSTGGGDSGRPPANY
jgi:hypothetical protein